MIQPHEPVLILTGGTMTSEPNEHGLLIPSANMDAAINNAGLDSKKAVRPYTIDSIDFNISEHYPLLRDAVIKALEEGHTPIICGGTDTLVWYSSLLTHDLMRRGYLQEDSGEKVIFLSSMKSLKEAPQHVENIIKAGNYFSTLDLSGSFAISADTDEADRFTVHDVINNFDKISGELTSAFQSKCAMGYLHLNNNDFSFHPILSYHKPQSPHTPLAEGLQRIAPPLLSGHNSEAMLSYMKAMMCANPPFDGIIIEGFPLITSKIFTRHLNELVETTRQLTERGIRVIFCNPVKFNNTSLKMEPLVSSDRVSSPSGQLETKLIAAGAEYIKSGTIARDTYIEAMLDRPQWPANEKMDPFPQLTKELTQKELKIRYIPDTSIMKSAIDALMPCTKNITFYALPHGVVSARIIPKPTGNHRPHLHTCFEYDGNTYHTPAGAIMEGVAANPYGAGWTNLKPLSQSHGQGK